MVEELLEVVEPVVEEEPPADETPLAEALFELGVAPPVPAGLVGPSPLFEAPVLVAPPPLPVFVFVAPVPELELFVAEPAPPPSLSSSAYRGASTAAAEGSKAIERSMKLSWADSSAHSPAIRPSYELT